LVNARVGGVDGPGNFVEAYLAFDLFFESAPQGVVTVGGRGNEELLMVNWEWLEEEEIKSEV